MKMTMVQLYLVTDNCLLNLGGMSRRERLDHKQIFIASNWLSGDSARGRSLRTSN